MKISELYAALDEKIPSSLSCEWDNDGLMCMADDREVTRVLCALDATEEIVDRAVFGRYDIVITHHPLIFSRLASVTPSDNVGRKIIKLISGGVSAFSFHTRADAHIDGVNARLADMLGLRDVKPFGPEGETMGRIGTVNECTLPEFCGKVKEVLGTPAVLASGALPVSRVAVLGGDGKDFVSAAIAEGADTYLSGRISYNLTLEASERGINLVEAGHYYTERHICKMLAEYVKELVPSATVDIAESNTIKLY